MSEKINIDTAIYAAVKELDAELIAALPSTEVLSKKYQQNYEKEKTIYNRIKNKERKNIFFNVQKHLVKIVIVTALVFTVAFSPFLTANAVQVAVSETAVEWYEKYITVESNTTNAVNGIKDLKVEYMTEGFMLKEEYFRGESVAKDYFKGNAYLSVSARVDNNASLLGLDNERSDFYPIEINKNKGLLMNGEDGYNNLVIVDNGIRYMVSGYVNIDEILKIYKNLKISL